MVSYQSTSCCTSVSVELTFEKQRTGEGGFGSRELMVVKTKGSYIKAKSELLVGSFFRIHVPPPVRSGLQIFVKPMLKTGGKKRSKG